MSEPAPQKIKPTYGITGATNAPTFVYARTSAAKSTSTQVRGTPAGAEGPQDLTLFESGGIAYEGLDVARVALGRATCD